MLSAKREQKLSMGRNSKPDMKRYPDAMTVPSPGHYRDAISRLNSEIKRLEGVVTSLTQQLHDAHNEILWLDLIAACRNNTCRQVSP
jgi:hypothetical protein